MSHSALHKSVPSSPTYGLGRTDGRVPIPSHHEAVERQRLSARPRSLAGSFHLKELPGYDRLAAVPNGVERIRDADTRLRNQVPRSRGLPQLSNRDLCTYTSQPSRPKVESEYELYPTSPRKRPRVSLETTFDPSPGYGQTSSFASDTGLAYTGSWCQSTPFDVSEAQLEVHDAERDVLSEDWRPRTPIDTRLSTPDLPPLSTDYEFCPCHLPGEHGQDRINEDFYFATRSKMDKQMVDALAHIVQNKSSPGQEDRCLCR
ncbi:hypothetical protein FLONG3_7051 [Fusarium longipes]|uniref:Uncharacterized protein n=1 Tax=Fusarium longipes TaxID=694270 RepID=A0A395SGT8_9HYPO|nr:hypothetical protein FLONG3_7051 [Fusarium longipes]